MLGAVIGDMIGSPYEGACCRNRKTQLLTDGCDFSDDTVLTVAVADAVLDGHEIAGRLRAWTRAYPNRGYGGSFLEWASTDNTRPYASFSNGGAMRVSPVALVASTLEEALALAKQTAEPTHGHPAGMAGAQAIAAAVFLARTGHDVGDIRKYIETTFEYNLGGSVAQRAEVFGFSTLAEDTVPDALVAAFEADSFEQALRNALFIGGDSDTLACMAGAIAEARFGIPDNYVQFARARLPAAMLTTLERLYLKAGLPFPLPSQESGAGKLPLALAVTWPESHWWTAFFRLLKHKK